MRFETTRQLLQPADVLAIGVGEAAPRALPEAVSQALPGLVDHLEAEEFKGSLGSTLSLPSLGAVPARWIVIVGTGKGDTNDLRVAAGLAASFARDKGGSRMVLNLDAGSSEATCAVVEGAWAGNYRFDRYKPEDERKRSLSEVALAGAEEGAVARGRAHAAGQTLARNLVNETADVVYPQTLAQAAADLAGGQLTVEIWDEDRIRAEGMGGITAVGQGSHRKPRFVHMRYEPEGEVRGHVALVGKGVTFDAGGLSIKPSGGMQTMRCDMGGAGAVIGAMSALNALKPAVRVDGIFAAAENMVSANCYKLGDVLTMHNGKTVEIHNTDAEGRLLLADCLSYASQTGATHVIDLATLTGAAVVALGEHYTALYSDDEVLAGGLMEAAEGAGEGFWRMPLEPLYKSKLKAEWAGIKNIGDRWGGSITAALFLQEFVDGPKWAHLDIAGPAFLDSPERHLCKGATGQPVRTLLRWLEAW